MFLGAREINRRVFLVTRVIASSICSRIKQIGNFAGLYFSRGYKFLSVNSVYYLVVSNIIVVYSRNGKAWSLADSARFATLHDRSNKQAAANHSAAMTTIINNRLLYIYIYYIRARRFRRDCARDCFPATRGSIGGGYFWFCYARPANGGFISKKLLICRRRINNTRLPTLADTDRTTDDNDPL